MKNKNGIASKKLISVIIPVYNAEAYLAAAIDSVLAQAYEPLEIILVDDGSTDNSAGVARQFGDKVRYHFQATGNAAAARNAGVKMSEGVLLTFLDADDRWTENKLCRQLETLEGDPDLDMVIGHVRQFHSPELPEEIKQHIGMTADVMPGKHVGAMMIRRESFFKVGYFATDWKLGEFLDWYARAAESGLKRVMLPDIVMERRLHKTSQGTYNRQHRVDYLHILKASLDRRRKTNDGFVGFDPDNTVPGER